MIVAGYYGFILDVRVSVRLSVVCPSICFSFPDDNLSNHQWIFTKLGMCIDIMEIWFGILMGKFLQIFTELSARDTIMAGYYSLMFLLAFVLGLYCLLKPVEYLTHLCLGSHKRDMAKQ